MEDESKFTLTRVVEAPGILVYRMGLPDTRMGSTDIMFTSAPLGERIIITGDFEPGRHTDGVISKLGYDLGWFAGRKGLDYLCEKFLRSGFHPAHARRVLLDQLEETQRELAEDDPDDEQKTKMEARIEALTDAIAAADHGDDPTRSYESFSDLAVELYGCSDICEGSISYDPDEAERLGKIQQRFARLYAALESEPVPSTTPTGEAPKC